MIAEMDLVYENHLLINTVAMMKNSCMKYPGIFTSKMFVVYSQSKRSVLLCFSIYFEWACQDF